MTPGVLRAGLGLAALVLVACDDDAAGPAEPGPEVDVGGRVVAYDLDLDLATGRVRATLDVAVATPGDCLRLASVHTPSDVRWNGGAPTRVVHADGALVVCGPRAAVGRLTLAATVVVPEATSGEVGLRRRAYGDGTATTLVAWLDGCGRIAPCDPRSDVHVDVTIAVDHPAGTTVLCPGALTPGATRTRCVARAVPTYAAFTVAAHAGWVRRPVATTAGGLDLVVYERPEGTMATALAAAGLADFVTHLEARLGPYPYGDELRFAALPIGWLGFEPPAQVLLQHTLSDAPAHALANPLVHTALHEIVHQWAGLRTTLARPEDIMWKEAVAEYLTWIWEDERRPASEGAATIAAMDRAGTTAGIHPVPRDDPPPPLEVVTFQAYGVGPMALLVQTEALLGRDVVRAALADFLAAPVRATADLQAALEAASGEDLGPYFAAWVVGAGEPERPSFDVVVTPGAGDAVTVTVTQDAEAAATLFPCVVEVALVGRATTVHVPVSFGLAPTQRTAEASVAFADTLVEVVVDPRHRLMSWR